MLRTSHVCRAPWAIQSAAESAASAFGALARTMAMPKDGRTLEDVVSQIAKVWTGV